MVCFFPSSLSRLLHIRMSIGLVIWMIDVRLQHTAYSLVTLLSLGLRRNKLSWLVQVLSLSIGLSPKQCLGFKPFFVSCIYVQPPFQLFGAIISTLLSLVQNPVFHSRSKRVELNVHFVRDKVLEKSINVRYVPSSEQLADALD